MAMAITAAVLSIAMSIVKFATSLGLTRVR